MKILRHSREKENNSCLSRATVSLDNRLAHGDLYLVKIAMPWPHTTTVEIEVLVSSHAMTQNNLSLVAEILILLPLNLSRQNDNTQTTITK